MSAPKPRPRERGAWDDDLADAVALVEAVLGDDLTGAGAVLRNMDTGPVAVVLAKVHAELYKATMRHLAENEPGTSIAPFRELAAEMVTRP